MAMNLKPRWHDKIWWHWHSETGTWFPTHSQFMVNNWLIFFVLPIAIPRNIPILFQGSILCSPGSKYQQCFVGFCWTKTQRQWNHHLWLLYHQISPLVFDMSLVYPSLPQLTYPLITLLLALRPSSHFSVFPGKKCLVVFFFQWIGWREHINRKP